MKKCLITGLTGTLAPHLAGSVGSLGTEVVGWDRTAVNPEDVESSRAWLESVQPDAIAHLAMGKVEWATQLARFAYTRSIPFLFTSTAMVFHNNPDGPHKPGDERNALDEYGKYKILCEDVVLDANPDACIARIGWQIDPHQKGNNMLMALDSWQSKEGQVAASRAWRPACSFMEDTAATLAAMLHAHESGVLHLDSNADEGHTFDKVVLAMKAAFGRDDWVVRIHDDYRHDQRLIGGARHLPPLSTRLPL